MLWIVSKGTTTLGELATLTPPLVPKTAIELMMALAKFISVTSEVYPRYKNAKISTRTSVEPKTALMITAVVKPLRRMRALTCVSHVQLPGSQNVYDERPSAVFTKL